ncbi:MAG TPA: hypothetical protein VEW95_09380 [Candidatus Limnocylindrales bacterium]|nr:hypothetical protein [Candidatus Limnocylindrales bacterium]
MYERWRVNWLMESAMSEDDYVWPMATLYDLEVDDPMSGRTFHPREPRIGPGRSPRGEPWIVDHGGGTPEMPGWISVAWSIDGETLTQLYDGEVRR